MMFEFFTFSFYDRRGVKYAITPLSVSWGYGSFGFALIQCERGIDGYFGTTRSLLSLSFKRYDSFVYLFNYMVWVQFAFIAFKAIEFGKRKPEPVDTNELPF